MHQWLYIINHTNTALTSRITHAAVAQQAYSQLGTKPTRPQDISALVNSAPELYLVYKEINEST